MSEESDGRASELPRGFGSPRPIRGDLRLTIIDTGELKVRFNPHCPQGHLLSDVGGLHGYNHTMQLFERTCARCRVTYPSRAVWCVIDPRYSQKMADETDGRGVELLAHRPLIAAGIGRLEIRLNRKPVGDIQIQLCGICRIGIIHLVFVQEEQRRLGYGRVLVQAALARGDSYSWTTTAIERDATGFWSSIGWSSPNTPRYCEHMRAADELTP